ncbi:MAG TPA: hypothetical protein VFQ80_10790 [Thermomicrobiales bacterium]|nr:hypothetical protein [Thermomicrobiales bacterium]
MAKTERKQDKATPAKHGNGHDAIEATNLTPADRTFIDAHADRLSDSTKRAKWIHDNEKEDRPGQTLATRDHAVIQRWAEARGGAPATVPGTEHDGRPGVLRFIFDPQSDDRLQKIGWDDWFKTFDARDLVFLFQEKKADGSQSNFFHFDSPRREHD